MIKDRFYSFRASPGWEDPGNGDNDWEQKMTDFKPPMIFPVWGCSLTPEEKADEWDAVVAGCEASDCKRGIIWEKAIGDIILGTSADDSDSE